MQSCHLISAYCHYLFKTPSDTLAGAAFLGGKGKQRKKKWKNTLETAGDIFQIFQKLQIHSEIVTSQPPLTRRDTYRNLPIYLCSFSVMVCVF